MRVVVTELRVRVQIAQKTHALDVFSAAPLRHALLPFFTKLTAARLLFSLCDRSLFVPTSLARHTGTAFRHPPSSVSSRSFTSAACAQRDAATMKENRHQKVQG